jgi:hypothetical protein
MNEEEADVVRECLRGTPLVAKLEQEMIDPATIPSEELFYFANKSSEFVVSPVGY